MKNLKPILKIILLACLITALLTLFACAEADAHTEHTFGEWEETSAGTCKVKGRKKRSCTVCGEEEIERTELGDHKFEEWVVITPVTCTEDGEMIRVCKICDETESKSVTASGHDFSEWTETVTPTCTQEGERQSVCRNCSLTRTEGIPCHEPDLGALVEGTPSPDCKTEGTLPHYECGLCGTLYGTDGAVIETAVYSLPHSYDEWRITIMFVPTCVGASFVRYCEVCDKVDQKFGTEDDHILSVETTEPTCTMGACEITTCKYCRHYEEKIVGEPLGHSEETYTVKSNSYHTEHCSVCDEALGEGIEHTDAGDGTCTECGGEIGPTEGIRFIKSQNTVTQEYYYSVIGYTGEVKNVVIPAEHDGLPVGGISDTAFLSKTNIVSVTMPDTVKRIEYWAFYKCTSLKKVRLSQNLEFIDSEAFSECSALEEIDLGSSLKTIGVGAFKNCVKLTTVTIPNTLATVEENAFAGCDALTSVKYIGKEAEYENINISAGNEKLTGAETDCCGIRVSFVDPEGFTYYSYVTERGSLVCEYIPDNEGYRLDGWYLGDTLWDFKTMRAGSDIELTASFTKLCAVTFDTACDISIPTQYVEAGGYITRPDTPQRGEQYQFDGWFIENTETEWVFVGEDRMTVTGDVTLVARWTIMTPPEVFLK